MNTTISLPEQLQHVRTILFYGDSLTDGSSYPDFVVNSLNAAFPKARFMVENSAKCGDTTRDLLRRWDDDVAAKHPDLISIMIGANDVPRPVPLAEYAANLDALIQKAKEADMRIVLMLTTHRAQPEADAAQEPYLAVVRQLAEKHALPLVDTNTAFRAAEKAGKQVLGPDGLHHGVDGFPTVARAWLDGLGLEKVPLVATVTPWPNTLSSWELSNPLPASREPLTLLATQTETWTPCDTAAAAQSLPWWDRPFLQRGGVMPLAGLTPEQAKGTTVLARTTYHAEEAGPALLRVGGSPPLRILLNGRSVWEQTAAHGYHPNADRVEVELRAGRNELIVQTTYVAFLQLQTSK